MKGKREDHTMRPPRQVRMNRGSTAPNLFSGCEDDTNFHYRLLSGELSREKKARRALMQAASLRGSRVSLTAPSDGVTTPLLATASTAPIELPRQQHSALYRLLSGRSRKRAFVAFNRALAFLIVLNVGAFVVESLPSVQEEGSPFSPWFYALEALSSCVFLLEYFARIWTIPESRYYRDRYPNPWRARLQYALTIRAMVDLLSCAPFFVELALPGHDLPTFTWVRSFRLFRILKSESSLRAFSSIYRVVWYNSEILSVALFIALLLMMATSTLLWYLPPPDDAEDDFSSIPATFYLSILMLTGQGTPSGELPWYTKVIVMVTAVFSVPIFVIPASMLTWGFEAEAERLMRKKRELRRREKQARRAGAEPESSSSSSSAESGGSDEWDREWDEYEDVVLGGDDDEGGGGGGGGGVSEEERRLMQEVARFFSAADADGSGQLSMREFYEFQRAARLRHTHAQAEGGGEGEGEGGGEGRLARMERKIDELAAAVAEMQAARPGGQ